MRKISIIGVAISILFLACVDTNPDEQAITQSSNNNGSGCGGEFFT
jgi:hypothetical protein